MDMADHSPPGAKQGPQLLETDVPLSQSVIWRLQRDFYAQRGLKAWTEDLVPSYITNNPFIAEIYAQIVFGYLTDCMQGPQAGARPLSAQNPLHILELGAGTGKFSWLFLRRITDLLRKTKIVPQILRYSMSDCSESLLAEWRANPRLTEFVSDGILEFKLLNAGGEDNAALSASANAHPSATQTNGPLVVIANYVFDSLPQDAFMIANGQIAEALVSTTDAGITSGSGISGDQRTGTLSPLHLSFKNVTLSPDRYAEKSWNAILEHYRANLPAATVLFPSAALNLLQQLRNSSDGRMLVLAADKGFTREDDLVLSQGPPTLEFHASGHCFSQQVNFDAFARYFWTIGGESLLPQKHFSSLSVCAFIAHRPGDNFPATKAAYEESQSTFGPDDLFALMSWLNAHLEEVSIVQALALLRLTHWDTTAFLRLFPIIARQLRSASAERNDLLQAIRNTWANHYPVTGAENVLAFNCGVVLLELRFFADALGMFRASERQLGRTAATSYNLGLCSLGLGNSAEALNYMVEASKLDPEFEPARNSRLKLEREQAGS
jgi:tetratricopeptide (TPR) repeat protein